LCMFNRISDTVECNCTCDNMYFSLVRCEFIKIR